MQEAKMKATDTGKILPGVFTTVDVCRVFNAEFLDADQCRDWIIERLHPEGPRCLQCGEKIKSLPSRRSFLDGKRVRCKSCGKWFTVLTGTFLSGTQFNMREIFMLAFLLYMNMGNLPISKIFGVDQETIRLWRHKFDELLPRSKSA